jgi:pimeloyl-ACP methyl ester carboxylesterase
VHPADDGSRDHFLLRHLAYVLPPNGVAVARFDRRGNDVPLDIQVGDVLAVVEQLAASLYVDGRRIGLWGFSQGAWVAPLAATRSSKIAFLVLVASTGVTPAEQMLYGTARHVREAGYPEEAAEAVIATRRLVDEWRRGRASIDDAQRAVDELARHPWFEQAYLPRELSGAREWPDMDFDPAPIFAQVRVPTLLFYGEDDEWSPIDASIDAWTRAAERAGNRDVTIVRLPGTRHAPTLGGASSLRAVSPDYERTLVSWLKRVTRSG